MPVSKKVSPAVFCIFINMKGGKNLQSSPGNLKYLDLGTNLQGPWESFHQSAYLQVQLPFTQTLETVTRFSSRSLGRKWLCPPSPIGPHCLTSLPTVTLQWLTSIPSIALASLMLTDPGHQQRALFLMYSRDIETC